MKNSNETFSLITLQNEPIPNFKDTFSFSETKLPQERDLVKQLVREYLKQNHPQLKKAATAKNPNPFALYLMGGCYFHGFSEGNIIQNRKKGQKSCHCLVGKKSATSFKA